LSALFEKFQPGIRSVGTYVPHRNYYLTTLFVLQVMWRKKTYFHSKLTWKQCVFFTRVGEYWAQSIRKSTADKAGESLVIRLKACNGTSILVAKATPSKSALIYGIESVKKKCNPMKPFERKNPQVGQNSPSLESRQSSALLHQIKVIQNRLTVVIWH